MKRKKMTERQRRFVDFFIETGNATEAARRAGYSEKTAYSIGNENMNKPEIMKAIHTRLRRMEDRRVADAQSVMHFLSEAMRGEIEEKICIVESRSDGSKATRQIKKQTSVRDRLRAAELLMRRYGLDMSDEEKAEKAARAAYLQKKEESENREEADSRAAGSSVRIYLPDNGR